MNDKEEKNPVLVEEDGSTVIHLAAVLGHLNILKWYKEELNCSKINPEDNKGNTPLSQAINLDVVEFYMDCGYNATGIVIKISSKYKNIKLRPPNLTYLK